MARRVHRVVDVVEVSICRLKPLAGLRNKPVYLLAGLVLLGLGLRLPLVAGDPLHQDEALYGFWGRLVSTGHDPWLATVPVDKPPLVPYLIAGSQTLFGVSEFALRMPALAAALLSIPLTYVLAFRLFRQRPVALLAAAVMALTPYPVLFGASAFTDPILVAWWLVACWAALAGHWGWTGLALGLAFASKQQAVLLAPLVVGLGAIGWRDRSGPGKWWQALGRFALGLGVVLVAAFAWDAFRIAGGSAMGFWSQSVDSYGGLRLIHASELWPRFQGWLGLGRYLLGWSWAGGLFLVGCGLLLWQGLARPNQTREAVADLVLAAFALYYFFLHWLIAFPVWDRYLLPLLPILGILLGRAAVLVGRKLFLRAGGRHGSAQWSRFAGYSLLIAILILSGLFAVQARVPIGGDHGAYDGLKDVVAFLRQLPVGTVLYDRWLSWHYDFYLFDAYLFRAGFPTPDWLANDAAAFYDGRPRYLVLPDWEAPARLTRELAEVGLNLAPVMTAHRRDGTSSFVVYEIGSTRGGIAP